VVAIGDLLTGAEMIVEALKSEGVDTVFGYPGGAVLPLYDALYRHQELRHILTRHEQGAIHAADGYARSTGKPGVVLATSGPGATNLVTGIANAYMDSVPLVVFTGQVARSLIGRDSFQEADITGITSPITKYSYLLKRVEDLPQVVRAAFHLAATGRPGPVLIDLPKDVTTQKAPFNYPPAVSLPGYRVAGAAGPDTLAAALELLNQAERPLICAGGGVIAAGASKLVQELAQRLDAPVTTTFMGKGSFPETSGPALGMLGMHGTAYANYAVQECDLFLALGMRFDDRVTGDLQSFAPRARIIHVDIDAAELNKNMTAQVAIAGDVAKVLEQILQELRPCRRPQWTARIRELKEKFPLHYDVTGSLKPQYVIQKIYQVTGGEAFLATDVGQHQMWAAQYYLLEKPRRFISSGGLGTMGFGLPAALGVQVAHPQALVFHIAGDGSLQMNSQELATAVNYNLPVKIAVIDNRYLGMVRQWQDLFFDKRYSQTDLTGSPDFVKLAEAYGAVGIRVEKPEEVEGALEEAINTPRPVLLDFIVDREENVFPMVPAGEPLTNMLEGR